MLAPDRVVEEVVLIVNAGETFDGGTEELELSAALVGIVHDAQPSQAEVRRGHELGTRLRLRQCECEQSPQIEFIVSRETIQSADANRGLLPVPISIRKEIRRLENGVRLE